MSDQVKLALARACKQAERIEKQAHDTLWREVNPHDSPRINKLLHEWATVRQYHGECGARFDAGVDNPQEWRRFLEEAGQE